MSSKEMEANAGNKAASWYQDRVFRNLMCKRVQVDEIWAFVHCKQKNAATAKKAPANAGDIWTWTAIDADTKLIPSWFRGVHHALQGVDAAEPHDKFVAALLPQ
jgi:hypothetical protein